MVRFMKTLYYSKSLWLLWYEPNVSICSYVKRMQYMKSHAAVAATTTTVINLLAAAARHRFRGQRAGAIAAATVSATA